MNNKITIAIDGFSSTGKSTIAKLIAKKYNLLIIDTKIEKSTILIDLRAFAKSTLVIDNLLIKKDLYNSYL